MITKELIINLDHENSGVEAIAIVDEPAIMENFYYFNYQDVKCECRKIPKELDTYLFALTELYGEDDNGQYDSYQFELSDITKELIDSLKVIGTNKSDIPDTTNTIVRYRYNGPNPISTSRSFCKMMLSKKKLFTMQDIINMSSQLPASLFPGSPGPSQMGLFTYKGGANCRHYWEQVTFKVDDNGNKTETSVQIASGVNPPAQHKHSAYKFIDASKHICAGPIMIPDILIPRYDESLKTAYNVFFSKDTIKACSEKYHMKLKINSANEMHKAMKPVDVSLIESWIIEDPKMDKSSMYGFDLPAGTWFGLMKVNSIDTWQKIELGLYNGFSIEGNFTEVITN